MKPDFTDIKQIVDRHLPVASTEEAKVAGMRVWHRLRTPGDRVGDLETRLDHAQPATVSRWRGLELAAAAALVIAAAVGTAMLWPRADDRLFRVVEGDVRHDEMIRSNGGGGAVLALADGSRIEMRSHTELSLERTDDGLRIHLRAGGIIVNAAEQGAGHLYVQTKDMLVSVVGTVFLVNAEPEGSRVAVIEGEVRVQQGASEQNLRPGEQVTTNPNMDALPVAKEIEWSRQAGAHVALLQQSAAMGQQPAAAAAQTAKEPRVAFEVVSIRPSGPPPAPAPGARGGGRGLNSRPTPDGCVFDSYGYSYQVDPRRFAVTRTTLLHLAAYTIATTLPGLPERRPDARCDSLTRMGLLTGGPDWIRTDPWDIVATIPEGAFTRTPTLTDPVLQQMIRTLLVERFGWVIRRESKEMPVYLLRVGRDGPKFNGQIPLTIDRWGGANIVTRGPDGTPVPVADAPPPADGGFTIFGAGAGGLGAMRVGAVASGGQLSARNVSMTNLANHLYGLDGRPVLDRTGLTGRHDFHYAAPGVQASFARPISATVLEDNVGSNGSPDGPFSRALLKEIGLELEESTAPFDAWVIERAERPSEN